MAVSLTYDATLSRVLIDADGLAAADYATVERSLDQITWEVVRGGSEIVDLTGGAFDVPLSDYEFTPDVVNYYRVRGVTTDAISYVASGAGASNANASGSATITPVLPGSLVVGDLLIAQLSVRNTAGRFVAATGWTQMAEFDNVAFFGRRYQSGDTAPAWSHTGGVANATLLGQLHAFRDAELVPVTSASQANASTQNVAYPGLTVPADDLLILVAAWKQEDWAGITQLSGMTEIGDFWDTIGDDASQGTDYVVQTTAADIVAGSFTVAGAVTNAVSRGSVLALEHAAYLNSQSSSITPAIDAVWLKSVARPFLNQTVQIVQGSVQSIRRPARTGVFDIIGRSLPVAVNDVRKSRRWTMQARTETAGDRDLLTLLLASGDVLLIQVPASCADLVPAGYVTVEDTDQSWHALRPLSVLHTMPVIEVAEPSADVVAATQTWATVLATYATWSDVIAAHPDWADLLTLIGDPSEVIVP